LVTARVLNFFVTLPVAADLASLKRLFAMYRVDADLYPTAEGQTVMLVTDWQYSIEELQRVADEIAAGLLKKS
jgi:hypothetical protein